jgi:hypothetical protein
MVEKNPQGAEIKKGEDIMPKRFKARAQPNNVAKKSAGGEGRKKAEKWWECHTFSHNTAGPSQRLMCVFKKIAGVP